jgi:hypothetical protein
MGINSELNSDMELVIGFFFQREQPTAKINFRKVDKRIYNTHSAISFLLYYAQLRKKHSQ